MRLRTHVVCATALAAGLAASAAGAAVITVTTTLDDTIDNGNCTLREAILSANFDFPYDQCTEGVGYDVVLVPAGTYTLTKVGADDVGVYGDLDIFTEMAVTGVGTDQTIIDGDGEDRVFDIVSADVDLELMTIRNGQVLAGERGGCIRIDDQDGTGGDQDVMLDGVRVTGCQADGPGGGLAAQVDDLSVLTIRESAFDGSGTAGGGVGGGGLLFALGSSGSVVIERSSFTGSTDGACVYLSGQNQGSRLEATVRSSTVAHCQNQGVYANHTDVELEFATLAGSQSDGLYIANSGDLTIGGTIVDSVDCFSNTVFLSTGDNLYADSGWACNHGPPSTFTDRMVATPADLRLVDAPVQSGSWRPSLPPRGDSLAVDGGGLTCPAEDQDGRSRPLDNDGDGGSLCTLGAVETAAPVMYELPFDDGFESGDTSAWSDAVG